MEVMGISGLPGSGKSLVSEIAAKKGAAVVSMGDIIREAVSYTHLTLPTNREV